MQPRLQNSPFLKKSIMMQFYEQKAITLKPTDDKDHFGTVARHVMLSIMSKFGKVPFEIS